MFPPNLPSGMIACSFAPAGHTPIVPKKGSTGIAMSSRRSLPTVFETPEATLPDNGWVAMNYMTARVRIASQMGLLAAVALSSGVACGGSSSENPAAEDRVLFSRSGEIYVIKVDGSGERSLTQSPANEIAPVGSPNGRTIAFASDVDGELEVPLMNADGSGR
jgi:hypothetical protein